MMKMLVALVVVGLAAVARCDEDLYSASAPQYYQPQHTSSYSNYQPTAPQHYGNGFLDGVFGNTRRQFGGIGGIFGGIGIAPIIGIVVAIAIAVALFAAAAYISTNSSGRGLDTDDWEVDHSVWMNQLQKDFEDSWSTE